MSNKQLDADVNNLNNLILPISDAKFCTVDWSLFLYLPDRVPFSPNWILGRVSGSTLSYFLQSVANHETVAEWLQILSVIRLSHNNSWEHLPKTKLIQLTVLKALLKYFKLQIFSEI